MSAYELNRLLFDLKMHDELVDELENCLLYTSPSPRDS